MGVELSPCQSKLGDDGGPRLALQIASPNEIGGPLALGHSSHFGLGLFMPEIADGKGK